VIRRYTEEERLAARRATLRRYAEKNRDKSAAKREANREASREYFRRRSIEKAAEISEKNRRRYVEDPERYKAKERRRREADPEAYRARQRERRAARREIIREQARRWAAENPERVRAQRQRWYAANPEKARRYANKRRALRAGVPSEPWTTLEILERDGWICQICGGPIDPGAAPRTRWSGSADHIRPINKGGHDTLDNVQAAHMSCNGAKRDFWEEPAAGEDVA
jgi:5-methylcytosine-specific restriction endonuclease McrA